MSKDILNETLYDVYVPIDLLKQVKSSSKKSLNNDTRVLLQNNTSAFINGTFIGTVIEESNQLYSKVGSYIEVLDSNPVFNPNQSQGILCTKADLSIIFPTGKDTIGKICYSDEEVLIIRLTKPITTVELDRVYDSYEEDVIEDDLLDILTELYSEEEPVKVEKKEVKEDKSMNNMFGNLGFGKLKSDRFKLSMSGIAVLQGASGKYVVYNKDNNEFVDVTEMLFDIKDGLFTLPAIEIAIGDVVLHNDKPYYIVDNSNEIKAVSYDDCTQTVLIPKTTMFGLKFFTKIFSMFGDTFANNGEIFSNPMMLMTLMGGEGNGDLSKMLMFSSLAKGDLGSNPMMLAMMLKDGDDKTDLSSLAMMSMMTGGTNPFAPAKPARNLNDKAKPTPAPANKE